MSDKDKTMFHVITINDGFAYDRYEGLGSLLEWLRKRGRRYTVDVIRCYQEVPGLGRRHLHLAGWLGGGRSRLLPIDELEQALYRHAAVGGSARRRGLLVYVLILKRVKKKQTKQSSKANKDV